MSTNGKDQGKGQGNSRVRIRQLPTGVPGLDEILGGGLPEYSFNIIAGAPGCGKTTLAHQFMFANATPERPALYFTVLGEPAIKMLRYQRGNGVIWDRAGAKGLHLHTDWSRLTDRVAQLHLALFRQARRHHILGGIAGRVGPNAIDACRVLTTERRAAVAGVFAVGINGVLPAGEPGMYGGPSHKRSTIRIDEDLRLGIGLQGLLLKHRFNHRGPHIVPYPCERRAGRRRRRLLTGNNRHAVNAMRPTLTILNTYLGCAVGGEIRQEPGTPGYSEPPRQLVR